MSIQNNPDTMKRGQTVVIAGLWAQIISFGLFIVNALVWWLRMKKAPTYLSQRTPWVKHMCVLLFAGLMIFIRCIYRVIEYEQVSGGDVGELMGHEVYQYTLDALEMFLLMIIFHWAHPSEVVSLIRGGNVATLWKVYRVAPMAKEDDIHIGSPHGIMGSGQSWYRPQSGDMLMGSGMPGTGWDPSHAQHDTRYPVPQPPGQSGYVVYGSKR